MDLGQTAPAEELEALFELRLRLPGKGHDQIGGDGAAGEILLQQPDALQIAGRVIPAVHPLQNGVAAALQAQMELGQRFSYPARARQKVSSTVRGSRDPSRTRQSGTASHSAATS